MIITREQQEEMVSKYMKENRTTDECIAFVEGANAAFKLLDKLMKQNT